MARALVTKIHIRITMAEQTRLQNPSRRRLARGAAATPVVLASITAKNALAGNYSCTTTGAQSGNMSHKHEDTDCYDVGHSCKHWKDTYKGNTRKFVQCLGVDYKGKTEKGTGKNAATNGKRMRASTRCSDSGWTSATCDQILNGTDHATYPVEEVDIVLAGLCAYLNAEAFGRSYYISMEDAKGLFLGALGKATFVKTGKSWTAAECRTHLALLYRAA
jgi:hypothetical protein